jgi:ABC-type thiamine transport system substrate-binding protein
MSKALITPAISGEFSKIAIETTARQFDVVIGLKTYSVHAVDTKEAFEKAEILRAQEMQDARDQQEDI